MEIKDNVHISIVIPTLGRYDHLRNLIRSLNLLGPIVSEIIIVDSTSKEHRQFLVNVPKVKHVLTIHKNGLYQRVLGSKVSSCDWILFLDNDMEVISDSIFYNLEVILNIKGLAGLALKFSEKHEDTTLGKIPKSIFNTSIKIAKLKGLLTGYPTLSEGKYWYCGIRGPQPITFSDTQWLSGGAFIARRELVFKGLNYRLLTYFEKKLGMGEDPLIGFMLSLKGKLLFYPNLCFLHNDQKDSAYSLDIYNYSKRVVFSRLYLSLERARLLSQSKLIGYCIFHWHTFFRILGLLINAIVNKNNLNILMLKGGLIGWFLSFNSGYRYSLKDENYWLEQIEIDLSLYNTSKNSE
jgi:GT2 family glycosyltransferase